MSAPNSAENQPLPPSIRILPNRSLLRLGLAAGLALAALVGGMHALLPGAPAPRPSGLDWSAIGAGLLIAAWCAFRLVVQLPIIEASELGVAIWFHGPYRRPFFAPWSRVGAVGVTRLAHAGWVRRRDIDVLAIDLIEDGEFRIPALPDGAKAPIRGAHPSQLAWPGAALDGGLRHWAAVMQAIKSADAATGNAFNPRPAGR